jgi:hypothetical protein
MQVKLQQIPTLATGGIRELSLSELEIRVTECCIFFKGNFRLWIILQFA